MSEGEVFGWDCKCGVGSQLTTAEAAKGCPADYPERCGLPLMARAVRVCRLSEDECARRCTAKPGGCDTFGEGLEADGRGCRVAGRRVVDGSVVLDLQPELTDGEAGTLTRVMGDPTGGGR